MSARIHIAGVVLVLTDSEQYAQCKRCGVRLWSRPVSMLSAVDRSGYDAEVRAAVRDHRCGAGAECGNS